MAEMKKINKQILRVRKDLRVKYTKLTQELHDVVERMDNFLESLGVEA